MNSQNNRDERRKSPRFKVQIWVQEKHVDSVYFHLVSNISLGGFFIDKKIPFPIGAEVNLEFEFDDINANLNIRGKVIDNYRDEETGNLGSGIRFIDLNVEQKLKIEEMLSLIKNG